MPRPYNPPVVRGVPLTPTTRRVRSTDVAGFAALAPGRRDFEPLIAVIVAYVP
ncbi:hypothetical protein GL263_11335 [Streptomyces durbertensis]|uniref:Uncharacterized protein n=1 Tax=Streptomyces durbertensis TaxID=2448886 RepID=A0ABR6EFN6_9ACTN|nr:hypothetical protein [Streptomyces durbertensis]MBB1244146.1 hypothetical protein [Streptomyces durbertensis]